MSEYPIDVLVTGHLCLDMHPDMGSVPREVLMRPGYLAETGPLALSTGGAVANVGLSLFKLGTKVKLVATVGADLIGRATLELINAFDPALTYAIHTQNGAVSSYTIALSPQHSDRTFLHCPGINGTFSAAQIDFTLLNRARAFYLGYPSLLPRLLVDDGAETELIFRQAHEAGVVTALDFTLPDPTGPGGRVDWRRLLTRSLPFVDLFVPSIEEILFMLRREDYEAWHGAIFEHLTMTYLQGLADDLIRMGVAITGFKLGPYGMYLRTAGHDRLARIRRAQLDPTRWADFEDYHPAFQVEVVGTTGAGDSAYAGLLTALLTGLSPSETIEFACAVGAHNVEAADAVSGVQSREQTTVRIRAGWPLRPEQVKP